MLNKIGAAMLFEERLITYDEYKKIVQEIESEEEEPKNADSIIRINSSFSN